MKAEEEATETERNESRDKDVDNKEVNMTKYSTAIKHNVQENSMYTSKCLLSVS